MLLTGIISTVVCFLADVDVSILMPAPSDDNGIEPLREEEMTEL